MNQNESVAIERVSQRLESLTGSVTAMQSTLSQTHNTVLGIQAEWKFWVEQSREHDGRLFVVEKAQFDTASELRHLRIEQERTGKECESAMKELREELEKKASSNWRIALAVMAFLQFLTVVFNLYINSTRK